jgi:cytochrome b involved in lipid metabolism
MAPANRPTKERSITAEEVAKHGCYNDCWVIFEGKVLALPKSLLDEHPGGSDALFSYAGKDCTSAFHQFGHSASAASWAKRYAIGNVDSGGKRQQDKEVMKTRLISALATFTLLDEPAKAAQASLAQAEDSFATEYATVLAAVISAASAGALAWKFIGMARQI